MVAHNFMLSVTIYLMSNEGKFMVTFMDVAR